MFRRSLVQTLPLLLAASALAAQTVRIEHGRVVYVPAAGAARELTHTGPDSAAALSPDGRTAAYVRYTGGTVSGSPQDAPATELRVVDVASGRERVLVRSAGSRIPERSLAGFQDPAFSPDGGTVYFVSSAWVTSGAVHAADVATGRERFVCPGSSVEVVPAGRYRGDLMVAQHRYWLGGGSYDWTWLLTPAGREVGPIGETDGQLAQFRESFVPQGARPPKTAPDRGAARRRVSAPAPASRGRR